MQVFWRSCQEDFLEFIPHSLFQFLFSFFSLGDFLTGKEAKLPEAEDKEREQEQPSQDAANEDPQGEEHGAGLNHLQEALTPTGGFSQPQDTPLLSSQLKGADHC